MAENKQRLLQLLDMLTMQFGNIGAQRRQGSQFRAGMQRDKAMMEQRRELALKQLDQRAAELKSENTFRAAQMKSMELDIERGRQETLYDIAAQPETTEAFTKRGAEQVTEGVTDDMRLLKRIGQIGANIGATARIAALGPRAGMTQEAFKEQQVAAGVDPAALSTLPEPEKTNYAQMKAAFDMSIVYGLELPAEFQAMPGVVEAITKGKAAYAKAQTDADKMAAIDLATAEANLIVAQYRAEHLGEVSGGGGSLEQDPIVPPGEPATNAQIKTELDKYLVIPEVSESGSVATMLALRVDELENSIAAYSQEGNEEISLYANNILRRLKDLIAQYVASESPLSEEEGGTPIDTGFKGSDWRGVGGGKF